MQARYFVELSEKQIQCNLCFRKCKINSGAFGVCNVRGNENGKGFIPYYGKVSSIAIDPIEKKPLYHYRPGSDIFSVGFLGCNLFCPFCQNYHISQNVKASSRYFSPQELIQRVLLSGCSQIAYTYSEPLVHAEYLLDCMVLAKKSGIENVLVTNGVVNKEAGEDILNLTSAANIDLKCFSEKTYREVLGGDLHSVTDFIVNAWRKNIHIEITTLIVPDLNDGEEEIKKCMDFIKSVSPHIPWHISAYHPCYKWNAPPTDPDFLFSISEKAKKVLSYVYVGNVRPPAGLNALRAPCNK